MKNTIVLLFTLFALMQALSANANPEPESPYYQKGITLIGYPAYPYQDNSKLFSTPEEQRQAYRMVLYRYGKVDIYTANQAMKELKQAGINLVIGEGNRYLMRGIGRETNHKTFELSTASFQDIIDNTKIMVQACHQNNMQFINHITCTMVDEGLLAKHPDWALIDLTTGKSQTNSYGSANSCVNNDDFMSIWMSRVEKLMKETGADGIMADEIQFFGWTQCGCKWCQEKFKRDTGFELPQTGDKRWFTMNNPAYRKWLEWRAEATNNRKIQLKALLKEYNSAATMLTYVSTNTISWIYYGAGCNGVEGFSTYADSVGYECQPDDFFYQYYWPYTIYEIKYLRAAAEDMGTGLWTLFYDQTLADQTLNWFIAMSQGSRRWWRIDPAQKESWQPVLAWEAKHQAVLMNTVSAANIGVLFSAQCRNRNPKNGEKWMKGFSGTCNALTDGHIPYKVIMDKDLTLEKLNKKDLQTLLLFNSAVISKDALDAIRNFVRNGGNVICSGNVSLCDEEYRTNNDFALADMFGFSYDGEKSDGAFLKVDKKNEITGSIKGNFKYTDKIIELKDLQPDVKVLGNMLDTNGREYPGILWRKYGKGNIVYFAGYPETQNYLYYLSSNKQNLIKPGKIWKDERNQDFCNIICNAASALNQKIPVKVENVPKGIVVEAYKQQFKDLKGIQVHLVNFLGCQIKEGQVPLINEISFPPVKSYLPDPSMPISLEVYAPETKKLYLISPDFDVIVDFPFKKQNGYACVSLPDFYRYFILYFSENDKDSEITALGKIVTAFPAAKEMITKEEEPLAGKYDEKALIVFADNPKIKGGLKRDTWKLKEPYLVLYGSESKVSQTIIDFDIKERINMPVLEIGGMDDNATTKAPLEIKLNGKVIFEGSSTFPDDKWAVRSFVISEKDLLLGKNTVEISNTGSGVKGNVPWMAISFVRIRTAQKKTDTAVIGLLSSDTAETGLNLVKNMPSDWKGAQKSNIVPSEGMESFETSNSIFNSLVIPVDKTKTYILSGWFKNNGDTHLNRVYFSLMPLDADKKRIKAINFNAYPFPGNETVLVAPCSPEDTILKIKDGSKWKKHKHGCVAFNVDDSGKMEDVPNRHLSSEGIVNVAKEGEHWEIHLSSKCGMSFPAGTKVREHADSNTYMYPVIIKDFNKDDGWKKISGKVTGMTQDTVSNHIFWPGTEFIKVGMHLSGPGKLIFSDIKLEEIK